MVERKDKELERRREVLVERLGSKSPTELQEGTLVVVPSLTFPVTELVKIIGIQFYEERLLFFLLLLRNPALRIVFVTSLRVEEPIVDYYLRFVPDEVRAGERLYLLALWDPETKSLTEKVLDHADSLERLKQLGGGDALLITFNVTPLEQRLSEQIGVPLYGCDPSLIHLGSKSGSRKVAREAGVPVLEGAEDLYSLDDVRTAISELAAARPGAVAAVVKLNEGFSGQGNVVIELADLGSSLETSGAVFCADEESWAAFAPKIAQGGAIVEELVRGPGLVSPSVQMRIGADGSTEVVSTHDQILGGPDGQVYLGCRFPADPSYRMAIQDHGLRVAKVLAAHGVIGSFGIDFVVVPGSGEPDIFLSEINLRLGGTTHPFLMTKLATNGTYDASTGDLIAGGRAKFYVATDNLKSESYTGLLPESLIRAIDDSGLAFDPATKVGVMLHLLGPLKKYGKVGITCVAGSPQEAGELYANAVSVLDGLAS